MNYSLAVGMLCVLLSFVQSDSLYGGERTNRIHDTIGYVGNDSLENSVDTLTACFWFEASFSLFDNGGVVFKPLYLLRAVSWPSVSLYSSGVFYYPMTNISIHDRQKIFEDYCINVPNIHSNSNQAPYDSVFSLLFEMETLSFDSSFVVQVQGGPEYKQDFLFKLVKATIVVQYIDRMKIKIPPIDGLIIDRVEDTTILDVEAPFYYVHKVISIEPQLTKCW